MKLTQWELLYEQYKTMSDDKLNEIINDDSYDILAKEVAKEILSGIELNIINNKKKYIKLSKDTKKIYK